MRHLAPFLVALVALAWGPTAGGAERLFAYVVRAPESHRLEAQLTSVAPPKESIAWGSYLDATHSASGMGHLTINTSAVFPDSEQLKAAGFLEGWLTAERIHQHFQNMVAFYETSNNENGPAQFQFLATQEVWLRHQMNSSDTQQSPFWAYIRLLMAQFDGLVQGYHARAQRPSCPDCNPVQNVQQSSSISSGQKSTHTQHPSLGQGQGLSGGLLQGQGQSQGQGQGQGFRRLLAQPLHRTTSLASLPQRGLGSGLASSAAGAEQPGAAGEEQPEAAEEEPLQLLSRVPHLTSAQLYFLCSLGDLGDITAALNRRQAMASQADSRQQGRQQAGGQQHGQQGQQGAQEREQVQGISANTQGSSQGRGQEAAGHSNTSSSSGSARGSSSGSSKVGRRRHEPGSGLVTDWDSLSPRELAVELAAPGRCTAFVKVTPDFSDIFVAQAAWFTYAAMVRIFKHYHFKLHDTSLPGTDLAYSSYPGQLSSDDDFYLVNPTHLAVLQTTNRLFNESLLDTIQPQAVLSWQRVRSALSAASSGKEWAQLVGLHNSGTYTNSWLVIDLKRFSPGRPLQHGLLTVVEQVPDAMFSADFTHILESGYFALYNVPALQPAYEALGYPAFLASQEARGPLYAAAVSGISYQLAPRAKMLRRDQAAVTTLDAAKRLMRYNNYKTDPFSSGISYNAICGRGDTDPDTPALKGCYDGKVSSFAMALALEAEVVNGPTVTPDLPPFTWEGRWQNALLHLGQPQRFNFTWERMAPVAWL